MDDIFEDLIMEGVVMVYLDDILIFMETLEEHRTVTWGAMELLQKHNLFLKPEKCKFKKTKVEYLGVIILLRWTQSRCYDFERFRLFVAVILASRLRSSSVETKECL